MSFFRNREKEQKLVDFKQVETKQNDEKADVDREAKCSTRQEQKYYRIKRPVCDFQTRRVKRTIQSAIKEEELVERYGV